MTFVGVAALAYSLIAGSGDIASQQTREEACKMPRVSQCTGIMQLGSRMPVDARSPR